MPPRRFQFLAPIALGLCCALLGAEARQPPDGNSDEEILAQAGIASDGPGLLAFFKKATLDDNSRAEIARLIQRLGDEDFAIREEATRQLIATGHKALPQLRQAGASKDLETAVRAARCLRELGDDDTARLAVPAARLLAARNPAGATPVLLEFLPQAESYAIEEPVIAALAAVGVTAGKPDAALVAALKDASGSCRAAAARVLGTLDNPELRQAVRGLLKDDDVKVRFQTAHALVVGKEKEAVPTLIALLTDAPWLLALRSKEVLGFIAGEKSPPRALGTTDADRKECRAAWEAWWQQEANKIDLAALDWQKRALGYTLVCLCFGKDGDKVIELGPDGKVRWEISGLHNPRDAQVLPGNRVLIAEYGKERGKGRATERAIGGKITWEFQFRHREGRGGGGVVSCQRLPNGNTFLASFDGWICELTPEKKEIYQFGPSIDGKDFHHVRKLRNGDIAAACGAITPGQNEFMLLDARGKIKNRCRVGSSTDGAWQSLDELPGGGVLLASNNTLHEFDKEGKEVSALKLRSHHVSASRLPSGNYLITDINLLRELDRSGKEVVRHAFDDGQPVWAKRR